MTRTLTAPEITGLVAAHARSHIRLEIQNAARTGWNDLTAALHGYSIGTNVDQSVISGTIELTRIPTGNASLSPLVTNALDAGRGVRLYVTTLQPAVTPSAGDLRLVFDGEVDDVDAGGQLIQLSVRDRIGAVLADRHTIEPMEVMRTPAGYQLETLLDMVLYHAALYNGANAGLAHDIPTDFAASDVTLGNGPSFPLTVALRIEPTTLLEVMREGANRIGWQLRPRWNDTAGEFRLAFYDPPRSKVTADYTIPADRYIAVPRVSVDREYIRNVIRVSYPGPFWGPPDPLPWGRPYVEVEDAASIARFGRRFMQITEGDDSPIVTEALATMLAQAALSDLANPGVDMDVEVLMRWPVDIDDVVTLGANDEQFTTAQTLAVVGYRHEYGPDRERTILQLRGKPTGSVEAWQWRPRLPIPDDVDEDSQPTVSTPELEWDGDRVLVNVTGYNVRTVPSEESIIGRVWRGQAAIDRRDAAGGESFYDPFDTLGSHWTLYNWGGPGSAAIVSGRLRLTDGAYSWPRVALSPQQSIVGRRVSVQVFQGPDAGAEAYLGAYRASNTAGGYGIIAGFYTTAGVERYYLYIPGMAGATDAPNTAGYTRFGIVHTGTSIEIQGSVDGTSWVALRQTTDATLVGNFGGDDVIVALEGSSGSYMEFDDLRIEPLGDAALEFSLADHDIALYGASTGTISTKVDDTPINHPAADGVAAAILVRVAGVGTDGVLGKPAQTFRLRYADKTLDLELTLTFNHTTRKLTITPSLSGSSTVERIAIYMRKGASTLSDANPDERWLIGEWPVNTTIAPQSVTEGTWYVAVRGIAGDQSRGTAIEKSIEIPAVDDPPPPTPANGTVQLVQLQSYRTPARHRVTWDYEAGTNSGEYLTLERRIGKEPWELLAASLSPGAEQSADYSFQIGTTRLVRYQFRLTHYTAGGVVIDAPHVVQNDEMIDEDLLP
jgi:hypothetical protein